MVQLEFACLAFVEVKISELCCPVCIGELFRALHWRLISCGVCNKSTYVLLSMVCDVFVS